MPLGPSSNTIPIAVSSLRAASAAAQSLAARVSLRCLMSASIFATSSSSEPACKNFSGSCGTIRILGEDVTKFSPEKRAKYLSRVFQDPKMGTAPRMTVAENLLIAKFRGEKRGLFPRRLTSFKDEFQTTIEKVGNGLEKHLNTPIEFLSGGQRQALSLLMATLKRPELLLLDEHTAALDPKTSVALMELTDEFVKKDQLTALMITHHMEDALKYGNRLIVMKEGRIIQDLNNEEKAKMKISDYYQLFE